MPKFSVLLGRRTMQVHDIDKPVIRIGRDSGMDITIDNPSISRRQAEFRREDGGWVVEDLGSSNGTFLRDERLSEAQRVERGDEIGMGKFSVIFDKAVGDQTPTAAAQPVGTGFGTTQINTQELKALLESSKEQRRAHLLWESGGEKGTHYFSDGTAVLVGTDDLCDLRVPRGPKHHLLVVRTEEGCQVRNLSRWKRMRVGGSVTRQATLKDGDVVEVRGLKLTYVDDLA